MAVYDPCQRFSMSLRTLVSVQRAAMLGGWPAEFPAGQSDGFLERRLKLPPTLSDTLGVGQNGLVAYISHSWSGRPLPRPSGIIQPRITSSAWFSSASTKENSRQKEYPTKALVSVCPRTSLRNSAVLVFERLMKPHHAHVLF